MPTVGMGSLRDGVMVKVQLVWGPLPAEPPVAAPALPETPDPASPDVPDPPLPPVPLPAAPPLVEAPVPEEPPVGPAPPVVAPVPPPFEGLVLSLHAQATRATGPIKNQRLAIIFVFLLRVSGSRWR
jgi:hypothetical protein